MFGPRAHQQNLESEISRGASGQVFLSNERNPFPRCPRSANACAIIQAATYAERIQRGPYGKKIRELSAPRWTSCCVPVAGQPWRVAQFWWRRWNRLPASAMSRHSCRPKRHFQRGRRSPQQTLRYAARSKRAHTTGIQPPQAAKEHSWNMHANTADLGIERKPPLPQQEAHWNRRPKNKTK